MRRQLSPRKQSPRTKVDKYTLAESPSSQSTPLLPGGPPYRPIVRVSSLPSPSIPESEKYRAKDDATASLGSSNPETPPAATLAMLSAGAPSSMADLLKRRFSTPSAAAIIEADNNKRSSLTKGASKFISTTGSVLKSTVTAPMVAGKAVAQGAMKGGSAVLNAGVSGGKAVVDGGKAVAQGTGAVVLGGGKAFVEGTQTVVGFGGRTVAKGGKVVVKGVKKATKSTMGAIGVRQSTSAGKLSKWDEGVKVIEELLQPDSESYAIMTPEQRKALKNVKKLLIKGPSGDDNKIAHVPKELLYQQREQKSSRKLDYRESGENSNGAKDTVKKRRGSSSFILQEYAGVRTNSSLFEDDDLSEDEDDFEPEQHDGHLKPLPTIEDDDDEDLVSTELTKPRDVEDSKELKLQADEEKKSYVPPEFKQLTDDGKLRVFELLSWKSVTSWDFDIFELNDLTKGRPLLFMGWAILGSPYAQAAMAKECGMEGVTGHKDNGAVGGYTFVDDFKIPPHKLCNYLRVVEYDYHAENPYHNNIHAADVTQTLNALIQMTLREEHGILVACPPIKHFTILLSAVVHDVDHPGKTNGFHTKLGTELAVMYNDISVLENWHVARAFARMLDLSLLESTIHTSQVVSAKLHAQNRNSEYNILCNTTPEEFTAIRNLMIEAVLHTDMTKHFATVNAVKGLLMQEKEDVTWKLLMFMLHMADISSQAKSAPLFHLWTDRCMAEFFSQGDQEAQLGMPISPNCDRQTTSISESQIGFIKFVVEPAYEVLGLFIAEVQERVVPIVRQNLEYWQKQQEEKNEEEHTSAET